MANVVTGCEEENVKKESLKIQLIRNATMKITYAGRTFLTDPNFKLLKKNFFSKKRQFFNDFKLKKKSALVRCFHSTLLNLNY